MQDRSRHLLVGAALGVLGTLLALFIAALIVAYGGAYEIAASRDHTAGVRWFLDRTMHASVRARARRRPRRRWPRPTSRPAPANTSPCASTATAGPAWSPPHGAAA